MTLTINTAQAQSNEKPKLTITEDAFRQMSLDGAKKDALQDALELDKQKIRALENDRLIIYPVAGTLAGIILGLLIGNKLK